MKWFLVFLIGCGTDQLDCMDDCVDAYRPCREMAEQIADDVERHKAYLQCLNEAAACIGECDVN